MNSDQIFDSIIAMDPLDEEADYYGLVAWDFLPKHQPCVGKNCCEHHTGLREGFRSSNVKRRDRKK